jgi:hypothetical protein
MGRRNQAGGPSRRKSKKIFDGNPKETARENQGGVNRFDGVGSWKSNASIN